MTTTAIAAPKAQALRAFAERHRLRLRRDEEGSLIVPGRHGQLYDWDDGERLAVMVIGEHVTVKRWNAARRNCLAAGMDVIQNGDAEGTLRFDPANREQARAAIRAVGAYRRRHLSPERRAACVAALNRARASQDRGFTAPESTNAGPVGFPR